MPYPLAGKANRSEMEKKPLSYFVSHIYIVDTSAFTEWLCTATKDVMFVLRIFHSACLISVVFVYTTKHWAGSWGARGSCTIVK